MCGYVVEMELHRYVAPSLSLILARQNQLAILDCRLQLAQHLPKTQSDQQSYGVQLWLFTNYLKKEIRNMDTIGVRLRVLGDTGRFSPALQALIADAQVQPPIPRSSP